MKPILALGCVLAVSACAQKPEVISLDDIRDARGDLPGFETVINCSKAPRYIFDKNGEIVETVLPIRHPTCAEKEAQERSANLAATGDDRFKKLEATDDDRVPVDPLVDTPVVPTIPGDPIDLGCDGRLHCEPDSKTEPEAYRIWLKRAKERERSRSASAFF